MSATMEALQVRLDVLSLALVALARAVPAEFAAAAQGELRHELAQRLDGVHLPPQADEAIAADMGRLFSALEGRTA